MRIRSLESCQHHGYMSRTEQNYEEIFNPFNIISRWANPLVLINHKTIKVENRFLRVLSAPCCNNITHTSFLPWTIVSLLDGISLKSCVCVNKRVFFQVVPTGIDIHKCIEKINSLVSLHKYTTFKKKPIKKITLDINSSPINDKALI